MNNEKQLGGTSRIDDLDHFRGINNASESYPVHSRSSSG